MAQISNYLYSNINPYFNTFQQKYEFINIHPYVKNKRFSSNNIFSNYSLFDNKTNESNLINKNNDYNDNNTNINYYDFGPYMNIPLSYNSPKQKNYMNKSSEQDLNMMKLQLRCDLIGQKINQIQNQVQNFRESNSKDDKKILKKNRTYGNLNENKNLYRNKNNRKYQENDNEKKNFFKIPIPIKKEVGLSDGFRKKKNINNKRVHNISYINKNISNNYLINDYINNNSNFRQSFFFNTMNKPIKNQSMKENNRETKYNKNIINKINSNPNILKQKDNNIVKFNNYVGDVNFKNNYAPNPNGRINKNINKKTQLIRKNFSAQRSKSNNISPNKNNLIIKNRKQNGINTNINLEKSSNSVAKYGSFDQYFFNDNNYADNSYIKYIDTIKNNFNSINYNNLEKIKYNSFNNSKIIETNKIIKNNFVIQKGNNINIITKTNQKVNQKKSYSFNNKNYQIVNNYNNSMDKNKTFNLIKDRKNKNGIKAKNNSYKNNNKNNNKINNQTQINNNFNVNNNTNYYNFNYNQNNNSNIKKNYINKYKNIKNNKVNNFKSKNSIKSLTQKNSQNELVRDNIEESSTNEYQRFNHDYSNDDFVPSSDMINSLNNNINFEFIKKPSIISENKIKTNINSKRKQTSNTNNFNYKKLNKF